MNEPASQLQWRRRIGEGLAIVVSILLAFAIDALWDDRQERIEEQEVLAALVADFQLNRAEVAEVIETHEFGRQRVAALAQMTIDEVGALSNDEVVATVVEMANPRTFDPIRGTIDSLIGGGQLGIIRDRDLRKSLTSFINLSVDAEEDAAYIIQWSVMIWEAEVRHGGPWRTDGELSDEELFGKQGREIGDLSFLPRITAEHLSRIRGDSEFMGLILRNQVNAAHYVSEIEAVRVKIDEILFLLEA